MVLAAQPSVFFTVVGCVSMFSVLLSPAVVSPHVQRSMLIIVLPKISVF